MLSENYRVDVKLVVTAQNIFPQSKAIQEVK